MNKKKLFILYLLISKLILLNGCNTNTLQTISPNLQPDLKTNFSHLQKPLDKQNVRILHNIDIVKNRMAQSPQTYKKDSETSDIIKI